LANSIARSCYRKGIRIPDDLAIAGFNGDYGSLSSWCPLTTMQIPSYEMGLQIGRMAVQRVKDGSSIDVPSSTFVPSLIEGLSL
jgi:DNA-binding LacI/PurR family transcriptional regulator